MNGDTYQGHLENKLRSGYGIMVLENGAESYDGMWNNDDKVG